MKPGVWIFLGFLGAMIGLGFLVSQRFEGSPPAVLAPESIVLGPGPNPLIIEIDDPDSGVRNVHARLLDQAGSRNLGEESYPGTLLAGSDPEGKRQVFEIDLDLEKLRVADGNATLVVSVRDWSWRDTFAGNRTELSIPVEIDTRPPRLQVISGLTYMHQGGAAAAVYRVGEAVPQDGVFVDSTFYPGFPHPSGEENLRVALFAVPVEAAKDPSIRVVAVDRAGNRGTASFPARIQERNFQQSPLKIGRPFIERVAAPLADRAGLPSTTPTEAFKSVNEDLRARNEQTIRESLAREPVQQPLWSGSFHQLPNSAVMSRFAELRNYSLDDTSISQARHYGFDLASTANAPITAAAAGRVTYADDLGIYGLCVILDHGLGLASLYAHLSSIDVSVGDEVTQDAVLGYSGRTGLAGGDHLHFAMLVGETYVNPLEWWDAKWVRSHIEARLNPSTR
jgi:murein DD-endopeptidase MepM/ murein hydrolase activator NlpD